MPRNYYRCPACLWFISWAFTETIQNPLPNPSWKDDSDPGLVIGAHIEAVHPEMLYGLLIPFSVVNKSMKLLQQVRQ